MLPFETFLHEVEETLSASKRSLSDPDLTLQSIPWQKWWNSNMLPLRAVEEAFKLLKLRNTTKANTAKGRP